MNSSFSEPYYLGLRLYLIVYPSSRHNTDKVQYSEFSITKQYNIEILLSSIAQYTEQFFPILPSCRSNTENQLLQYWSPRKVNTRVVIDNICIVTQVQGVTEDPRCYWPVEMGLTEDPRGYWPIGLGLTEDATDAVMMQGPAGHLLSTVR